MKAIYTCLLLACGLLFFTACDEEEVARFDSDRAANFVIYSGNNYYQDNYTNLKSTVNFYTEYHTRGLDILEVPLKLGVMLEGTLSDQPVNVRLKTLPDDEYEPAEIVVPGDSAIAPGEYRRTITVACKKPTVYDKEYRSIVTFDYENSDIVPGTVERQQYVVTVTDAADWEQMNVNDADEWNEAYSSILGTYGPIKVRFILAALGALDYSYRSITNFYYYTTAYPPYGFRRVIAALKTSLQEYNDTHDTPLTEPDGTPVTFP